MESKAQLEFLISYKCWADKILYDALSIFTHEQLTKERPMLFGSMLKLLNHVFAMDNVWKHNLAGTSHGFKTRSPDHTPTFNDLRNCQSQLNQWYTEYITDLSTDKISEKIVFTFIGGEQSAMQRSDVIHHVVNHSTYHRGHIEGVFYTIDVEPPTTDIPVFIAQKNA